MSRLTLKEWNNNGKKIITSKFPEWFMKVGISKFPQCLGWVPWSGWCQDVPLMDLDQSLSLLTYRWLISTKFGFSHFLSLLSVLLLWLVFCEQSFWYFFVCYCFIRFVVCFFSPFLSFFLNNDFLFVWLEYSIFHDIIMINISSRHISLVVKSTLFGALVNTMN